MPGLYAIISPGEIKRGIDTFEGRVGHLMLLHRPGEGVQPILGLEGDDRLDIDPLALIVDLQAGQLVYTPRQMPIQFFTYEHRRWLEEHIMWGYPDQFPMLKLAAKWKVGGVAAMKEGLVQGFEIGMRLIDQLMHVHKQTRKNALKIAAWYLEHKLKPWQMTVEERGPDLDINEYREYERRQQCSDGASGNADG